MSETAHEKTNTENDEEPFPVSEKRIIAGIFIRLISKIHSEEKNNCIAYECVWFNQMQTKKVEL